MATPERKPLALMIAMGAKKPDDKAPEGDEPDGDEGEERPEHSDEDLLQACEDVIDAVNTKDASALNKALVAWQDLYESKKGSEE